MDSLCVMVIGERPRDILARTDGIVWIPGLLGSRADAYIESGGETGFFNDAWRRHSACRLGGRYRTFLRLFRKNPIGGPMYAKRARNGEIDWRGSELEWLDIHRARWDRVGAELEKRGLSRDWMRWTRENAREYNAQPQVELLLSLTGRYRRDVDRWLEPREDYARARFWKGYLPDAVATASGWLWTDYQDPAGSLERFNALIAATPKRALVSVYDCDDFYP